MTALGDEALALALDALDRRVGSGEGATKVATAARHAYEDLAQVCAPLIGHVGVDALTGRAVHLAQREYPWLAPTSEAQPVDGVFSHVVHCLEQQEPAVAGEAAGVVFARLIGLLVTFIGEPITASLLQKAWPDALAETSTEES
jgi:hypothetical protein